MYRIRRKESRRGVVLVEFALFLPLLVVLSLGTLEACDAIHLKQSLTVSAYEGIRSAILRDVEAGSIEAVCQQILDARGVNGATITIEPADPTAAPVGAFITVTISAAVSDNTPIRVFYNQPVVARATMAKEF